MKRKIIRLLLIFLFIILLIKSLYSATISVGEIYDGSIKDEWRRLHPGSGIRELLINRLAATNKFELVEEGYSSDYKITGSVTEFTITEIETGQKHPWDVGGIKIGVDALYEAKCTLNLRLYDAKTGKILSAFTATGIDDNIKMRIESKKWGTLYTSGDILASAFGRAVDDAVREIVIKISNYVGNSSHSYTKPTTTYPQQPTPSQEEYERKEHSAFMLCLGVGIGVGAYLYEKDRKKKVKEWEKQGKPTPKPEKPDLVVPYFVGAAACGLTAIIFHPSNFTFTPYISKGKSGLTGQIKLTIKFK